MDKKRNGLVLVLFWVLLLLTVSLVSAEANDESAGSVGNAAAIASNLAPDTLAPQAEVFGGIVCPVGSPAPLYFSDFEANNGGWTATGPANFCAWTS